MNVSGKPDLVLCSTYEPPQLVPKLKELAGRTCYVGNIYFVPPEELLCELVNPEGAIHNQRRGLFLLVVRLEDWNDAASTGVTIEGFAMVRRRCEILIHGVRRLSANEAARTIVAICRSPSMDAASAPVVQLLEQFETLIETVCSSMPRIKVIRVQNQESWADAFVPESQEMPQLEAVLGYYGRA